MLRGSLRRTEAELLRAVVCRILETVARTDEAVGEAESTVLETNVRRPEVLAPISRLAVGDALARAPLAQGSDGRRAERIALRDDLARLAGSTCCVDAVVLMRVEWIAVGYACAAYFGEALSRRSPSVADSRRESHAASQRESLDRHEGQEREQERASADRLPVPVDTARATTIVAMGPPNRCTMFTAVVAKLSFSFGTDA